MKAFLSGRIHRSRAIFCCIFPVGNPVAMNRPRIFVQIQNSNIESRLTRIILLANYHYEYFRYLDIVLYFCILRYLSRKYTKIRSN